MIIRNSCPSSSTFCALWPPMLLEFSVSLKGKFESILSLPLWFVGAGHWISLLLRVCLEIFTILVCTRRRILRRTLNQVKTSLDLVLLTYVAQVPLNAAHEIQFIVDCANRNLIAREMQHKIPWPYEDLCLPNQLPFRFLSRRPRTLNIAILLLTLRK